MVTYNTESVFYALADPIRREILDVLRSGECSAGEVASWFSVSRPAVSRHLRVLREAGLVRSEKDAQQRVYHLNPSALRAVDHWLDGYRVFWAARMHDLKRLVERDS